MLTCLIYHVFYFRSQVVQLFSRITLVISSELQCSVATKMKAIRPEAHVCCSESKKVYFVRTKNTDFLCDSKSYLPL